MVTGPISITTGIWAAVVGNPAKTGIPPVLTVYDIIARDGSNIIARDGSQIVSRNQ